jgi:hypothetical protein
MWTDWIANIADYHRMTGMCWLLNMVCTDHMGQNLLQPALKMYTTVHIIAKLQNVVTWFNKVLKISHNRQIFLHEADNMHNTKVIFASAALVDSMVTSWGTCSISKDENNQNNQASQQLKLPLIFHYEPENIKRMNQM